MIQSHEYTGVADVTVIGGGVVGCSIAYHLARRGLHDVVVLERETIGSGSTSKAAGGIRVMWPEEAEIRFSLESMSIFEHFAEEFGVDIGYRKIGYLFLISEPNDVLAFESRVAFWKSFGIDARLITPNEAGMIVPALRIDDLVAAVWSPGDGVAGPAEVTNGFARRARELGVRIIEGVQATGIDVESGRVRAVQTTAGTVQTGIVINAAGPAAARIARYAGVEIPVHPLRRHIFFTAPFPDIPGPVPLTTDLGSGFYFRKEMEQLLLCPGDAVDIGDDFTVSIDPSILNEVVQKALHRIPLVERARIAGGWAGLRPLTPDDHAIIGWSPRIEGLFLAVGFGGHGFQHSPATGRYVAEWIIDGKPSMDLSVFDPTRFDRGQARNQSGTPDAE